jgi:hypothetical protein
MRKLQSMYDLKQYLAVCAYRARIQKEYQKKYGKFVATSVSIFTILMKHVKVGIKFVLS